MASAINNAVARTADGTIEADVAVKIASESGRATPGFIGIPFRARPDASSYDIFYIHPGAAGGDHQASLTLSRSRSETGPTWTAMRRS